MLKDQETWLIVGLGNPGREYEKTRHNCGFRAMDILEKKLNCSIDKGKFQGLYGQCSYHGCKVLLLKPQTYMNLSGRSVLQLSAFFKIPPQQIIVLFDDISLAPGRLRILRRRSQRHQVHHPGTGQSGLPPCQNRRRCQAAPGLRSCRLGLSAFSANEEKDLVPALERAADAALCIIDHGVSEASNRFSGKA